jgi:hypothetical protein
VPELVNSWKLEITPETAALIQVEPFDVRTLPFDPGKTDVAQAAPVEIATPAEG